VPPCPRPHRGWPEDPSDPRRLLRGTVQRFAATLTSRICCAAGGTSAWSACDRCGWSSIRTSRA